MACCSQRSLDEAEQEAQERSKAIEKELKEEKRALNHQAQVLLLGTGESGKTTIFKQCQVLSRSCGLGVSLTVC